MKPRHLACLAPFFIALSAPVANALTLIWDGTTGNGVVDSVGGTWISSNTNWLVTAAGTNTAWVDGSDAVLTGDITSAAAQTLALGSNINAASLRADATNGNATTITGLTGTTLILGTGTLGTGNITDSVGTGSYGQNLTYNGVSGQSALLTLAANSGNATTSTNWNIASGKTFLVTASTAGQIVELNNNVIKLTGAGLVKIQGGATIQNGTFNVNAGTLSFAGSGSRNTTVANTVTVNVASGATLMVSKNSGSGSSFAQNTVLADGATLRQEAATSVGQSTVNSGTIVVNGAANILNSAGAGSAGNFTLSGGISGSGGLSFSNTNVPTGFATILSGTNSYVGGTTLTSGSLVLDYTAQNNSKLSDTGALTLTGGTTLTLTGGSHAEVVGSTTLSGTGIATLSRSSGTSTIALGALTRNSGMFLEVAQDSIATTSTPTANGVLLGVTRSGLLSTVDGLGNIVSLSTYADVNRLGGTIVDGPASNVRIITGGASGNTTVGANATINSLTNNSTGGVATVDLGTNTLNLGVAAALLSASGTTGMTLQNGTLTAGGTTGTAGELLVINNSATATILDAAIANNGAGVVKLTQTGTGVLTLKQANTFTGDTTTYGGTLNLSNGSALQNSTLNYSAGALVFDQSVATNTFTLGSLSGTKAVALLNNATTPAAITLTVGGNNANAIYSGVLSGTGGSLTKTGIGTLVLTGVNTYTGATTVSGGTLQIGDGVTNGSLSSTTGIDTTGGTLRYSQTNASATTVPAWANITGSGTVSLAVAGTSTTNRQWGGGNYTLASGFTGSLQIDSGRLSINANGFGGTTAVSVQNGGQLALFAGGTYANTINFSIAGSGYGEGSYESALRLGDTAATTINGTVTLTGDATIATGKSSGTGATATFNGGIGETGGARNLTLGTGSTGTGDAKGTYVFNAANTYTGDTTVTAGSLRVNNITGSGTGTGAVSVAAGALLGGSGSIGGAVNVTGVLAPGNSIESLATGSVTMNSGSSLGIEIQDTTGVGADLLAINGDLTLNGTVTLDLTKIGIGTWAANDKLTLASYTGTWNGGLFSVGGIAIADGGLFSTSDNQSWTLDYNDTVKGNNFAGDANGPSYVTMTAIPEPASILLGGLGLLTLLRRRRK